MEEMEKPLLSEEGPQTVLMDLRWLPRLNYLSDLPRTSTAAHVLPGEIASTLSKQIHESREIRNTPRSRMPRGIWKS